MNLYTVAQLWMGICECWMKEWIGVGVRTPIPVRQERRR